MFKFQTVYRFRPNGKVCYPWREQLVQKLKPSPKHAKYRLRSVVLQRIWDADKKQFVRNNAICVKYRKLCEITQIV